jgi:outer membrane protein assembly factor BamB
MSAPAWFASLGLVAATSQPPAADVPLTAPFAGEFVAPPAMTWKVPLPGRPVPSATHTELGGPLLHGAYVYVGSAAQDALLVLSRGDGSLVRSLPAGAPVEAAPVIAGDQLMYSDGSGTTWIYDLADLETPRWTHTGSAPILSTPVVTEKYLYITNVANVVYALDRSSGELVWRHSQKLDPRRSSELELYGAPSPTLVGDLLVSGFSDGTLVGLTADAGEVLWQRRVGEGQYPDIMGSARVRGGDLVVAGYTEPLVSVDAATRNVRWRVDVGGGQAALIGGGDGEKPVSFAAGDPSDRFVFHGGMDGQLRCIDGISGATLWTWDSDTQTALTRPVPTDAGLLVGASGGGLYLVDPATGEEAWRWQPGYHPSGVTAAPAVDGRQVVIVTNAGHIASFVVPVDSVAPKSFGAVGWFESR